MEIIKRDKSVVEFDAKKIESVLRKVFKNSKHSAPVKNAKEVASIVVNKVIVMNGDVSVEKIQDTIRDTLIEMNYSEEAKSFILYRDSKRRDRELVAEQEKFIEDYKKSSNTANSTVDDNSNVGTKNIGVLSTEIHKPRNIKTSRGMITNKLKKIYGNTFDAKQYIKDIEGHFIYKNDESTFPGPISPYCASISMYPFLIDGLKKIGGLSAAPKNLDSYCGMYINLIFAVSAQFAGAVATSEFLMYFDYFARLEFGEDYTEHSDEFYKIGPSFRKLMNETGLWFKNVQQLSTHDFKNEELNSLRDKIVFEAEAPMSKEELEEWLDDITKNPNSKTRHTLKDNTRTIRSQIHQHFQQIIYSINQPAAARGLQSAFVNFSYFDKAFFNGMFGEFYFPDGTQAVWESLNWLQKDFMMWFNAERLKTMLTFPVESFALVNIDGKWLDEENAKFVAEEYSRGHSFFTYISDTVDSLSSCCRLKNMVQTKEFNFTNGNMGVMTGSKSVISLNLSRITQEAHAKWMEESIDNMSFYDFLKQELVELLERVYKYHTAYNESLKDMYSANLLPIYKAGFIDLKKQYLTIGLNGLNEAAEFLGIECNLNDEYKLFCQMIFSTIKEQNLLHKTKELTFNTEQVPAESLAVKNYNWDKEDGYWVPEDRNLYASYIFKPSDKKLSVFEKIKLHGSEYIGEYLDGGSAAHINLEEHLTANQYSRILEYAAKVGCQYLTFNVPNACCEDCGFIAKQPFDVCPKCGSKNVSLYDRIIGYLTKISNWSNGRQIEQKTRVYSTFEK